MQMLNSNLIQGLSGDDNLIGSENDDIILGGEGNDTLHGGKDDDKLQGNQGDDIIYGDMGADNIRGGKGDDILLGGKGNDTLYGDMGDNVLTGGEGDDLFVISVNENATNEITDFSSQTGDQISLELFNSFTDFSELMITTDAKTGNTIINLPNNQILTFNDSVDLNAKNVILAGSNITPPPPILAANLAPVNTLSSSTLTTPEFTSIFVNGLSVADNDNTTLSSFVLQTSNGIINLDTSVAEGIISSQIGGNGTDYVIIKNATLTQLNNSFSDANGIKYTPKGGYFGNDSIIITSDDGQNTDQDTISLTIGEDANLQAFWAFDETSGTTATDSSSNNNNGTLTNMSAATESVSGKISTAFDFERSSNAEIVVPNSSSIDISGTQITIALWIYPEDLSGADQAIIGKTWTDGVSANPYYQYALEIDANETDSFYFYFGDTGNGLNSFRMSNQIAVQDVWQHVVFTYDGANVRGYINGIEKQSWAETSVIKARGDILRIGSDFASGQHIDARLDDVRIYDRPLTANEISTLFNAANISATAVLDSYNMALDTSITIGSSGILSNDTDPENDSLTSFLVTDVSSGTLSMQSNGSFTYTPNANFTGVDSFTYKVSDGFSSSNAATVNITVKSGAVALTGGVGADSLVGSTANDTITGYGGQDTISLNSDGVEDLIYYTATNDGATAGSNTGQDSITGFDVGLDKIMFGSVFNGGATDIDNITADDNFTFAIDTAPNYNVTHEALLRTGLADANLTEVNFTTLIANLNALTLTAASGENALIVAQGATQTGFYLYVENGATINNITVNELTLLGISNGQLTDANFDFF